MRGRAMRALVAKFVPTRERSVRNGFTMRSPTIRAGRNCRVLRTALERAPLVGAGLRSCPAPGRGVPLTGRQGRPGSGWQSERREEG
jgi:hypothetical protein